MKLLRGLTGPMLPATAVTIGNFDAVHLGHQALLQQLHQVAQQRQLRSTLVIFEPQPREYLTPDQAPPRLTDLATKLRLLQQTPLQQVLLLRFSSMLAALSAPDFIEQVLHRRLNCRYVLVGDDFKFGAQRQGDLALLQQGSVQYHYTLEQLPAVALAKQRISSSAIRQALAAGDLAWAQQALGRPYALQGRVVRGRQLGRQLQAPTANIVFAHPLPLQGVFACRVQLADQRRFDAVCNVGPAPTLESAQSSRGRLEVHLLAFDESLYGQRLHCEFHSKIRNSQRFSTLTELKRAIAQDSAIARSRLKTNRHD